MVISSTHYLVLTLLIPLLGASAIPVFRNQPNIRESVSLITSGGLLLVCILMYLNFDAVSPARLSLFEILPNLSFSFSLDPLGLIFILMSSFLWLLTTLYAIGYMRHHKENNQTRFYFFFAITMTTVMGIALADNLFTLYIFYELLTLSTFPLVVHAGTTKAKLGARTYLAVLLFSSILFFLPAIIQTWLVTGNLSFTQGGVFDKTTASSTLLTLLLPLFILGIGKGAIFPLHRWLPAAMVAPTPVSALLHAVAVVKGGVFTILKVCVYVFGLDLLQELPSTQILLYLSAITVLIASLVALRQDNLKKRLAYSTVSQLGYVTIGALLANKAGIIGGAMHMAIHGFGKITLFFCAGAILIMTGKTKVSELSGIGWQMPVTMTAFLIASLSIIGLPPTAGSWSKWFLLVSTVEAEQWLLMSVLGLSSLLNIFYLLPIGVRAFFSRQAGNPEPKRNLEAPISVLAAISLCTLMCLTLFLFPEPLYALASNIVVSQSSLTMNN